MTCITCNYDHANNAKMAFNHVTADGMSHGKLDIQTGHTRHIIGNNMNLKLSYTGLKLQSSV